MPKSNAYHIFVAGWSAHNAYLHGCLKRKTVDEAYDYFNRTNTHLTDDHQPKGNNQA